MTLSRRAHLFLLYRFLAAVFSVVSAKYVMDSAVDAMETNNMVLIMKTFAIYCVLAQFTAYLLKVQMSNISFLIVYSLPVITRYIVLRFPFGHVQYLAEGLSTCHFIYLVLSAVNTAMGRLSKDLTRWNGLVQFSELHPDLRTISHQLVLFWLVSFTYNVVYYTTQTTDEHFLYLSQMDWVTFVCACAGECCRTPVGLVATCVAVFYAFRYLYDWGYSLTRNDDLDNWLEEHELVMHLICIGFGNLALNQTTKHLDLKHGAFIMKITILFAAAIFLNCIFGMIDPVLLTFSALPTTKPSKHIRALFIYIFLAASSLFVVYMVCQMVSISATFPVTILCLSTSLQVLASVTTYVLYMCDCASSHPIENLDDIVSYIQSTVRTLDFIGFAFLACTGMWVIKTEQLSWIQTVLILQCYSNVWKRLQNGWKNFLLWRHTKKIDSFATASKSEISAHDDVCSICRQSMSSAIVTPCGHLFHRTCLKKCMDIKDSCPLCSRKLNVS